MTIRNKKNVYVVNDDDLTLILFKKVLKSSCDLEYFKFFNNPEDALNHIHYEFDVFQKIPDLILLDLYMPHMSGWEFMEKLNRKFSNPYIDVKIYTSSIKKEDIEKMNLYPNISNYISKPITVEILDEI